MCTLYANHTPWHDFSSNLTIVHTKGFVDVKNVTESGSEGYQGDTIVHYNYGPVLNEAFQTNFSTNATYTYNKHQIIDNIGYAVE